MRRPSAPPRHPRLARALVPTLVAAVAVAGLAPVASAADDAAVPRPEPAARSLFLGPEDVAATDGPAGVPAALRGDRTAPGPRPTLFPDSPRPPEADPRLVAPAPGAEAGAAVAGLGAPGLPAGTAAAVDATSGASISGTVTGAGGAAVAGAGVTVGGLNGAGGWQYTQAGPDGTYTVEGLPAGTYSVSFIPPPGVNLVAEYWDDAPSMTRATPVPVTGDAVITGIDAQLSTGGVVTGTVTGADGKPVAGASVTLSDSSVTGSTAYGMTQTDGTYSVTGVRPGTYVAYFSTFGTNFVAEYAGDTRDRAAATQITVTAGTTVPGVDAQLAVGGSVSGAVTGPDGTALTNAMVAVRASATPFSSAQYGYTDANGRYSVTGLVPGSYTVGFEKPYGSDLVAEYWRDTPVLAQATPVAVTAGADVPGIDARLARGGSITGRVTTVGGAPVADATVSAYAPISGGTAFAYTAPDGSYELTGLADGAYVTQFSAPGGLLGEYWKDVRQYDEATKVVVAGGGTTSGVDAELATGGSVTGTVTGPDGKAVADVQVAVLDLAGGGISSGVTRADGTYAVGALEPGWYVLAFRPSARDNLVPSYSGGTLLFDRATAVRVGGATPTTGVDARLVTGASVSGTVTGPDGKPVAGAPIDVSGAVGYGYTQTAADGTYTVRGLPSDTYTVGFAAWGRPDLALEYWKDATSWRSATTIDVVAPAALTRIDARLERAASASGTVRGVAGRSVAGVSVEVLDAAGDVVDGTYARPDSGAYSLAGLRAGSVKLAFGRASSQTPYVAQYYSGSATLAGAKSVGLTAGQDSGGLDVTLRTGASIAGRVTDAAGAPLADVQMVAFTPDDSLVSRGAMTGADGRYLIEGLTPGSYVVAAAWTADDDGDTFHGTGEVRPATGNVTVTGTATTSGIDVVVGAKAAVTVTDVLATSGFAPDIEWMMRKGISTGTRTGAGTAEFQPSAGVSRQAMAAFLYRAAGSPAYTPPTTAPFADVAVGASFYKEIAWLSEQGISTGYTINGQRVYLPTETVSREAMAAFIYRSKGKPAFAVPGESPFTDVVPGQAFGREILWLANAGISTGSLLPDGTRTYNPSTRVSREAMARFLHRASQVW